MRSSKSRSRNKSNRQRTLGNIVNRVFDSSGPEGKVRGTPQQIIDKYLALARDAQLSSDRVAEQSFLQHAEHYTRMLGEAQREMAERQGQQRPEGEDQPRFRDERGEDRQDRNPDRAPDRVQQDRREDRPQQHQRRDEAQPAPVRAEAEDAFPAARDVAAEAEAEGEALTAPAPAEVDAPPQAAPEATPEAAPESHAPVEVAEAKPRARRAPRAAAPRAPRAPRKAPAAEAPNGLASGD